MWQSSKIKGETALNQEIATLRLSASLAMTVVFSGSLKAKKDGIFAVLFY
ncbi:MAG: hypothetical protein IJM09_06295 [Neisseriaceae bacterium]|nr:hypothetical protein [Neisseriaceae bacterium]